MIAESHLLALVFLLLRLRRRTRFFLHLALLLSRKQVSKNYGEEAIGAIKTSCSTVIGKVVVVVVLTSLLVLEKMGGKFVRSCESLEVVAISACQAAATVCAWPYLAAVLQALISV
jgi:hypothetical protein